MKKCSSCKEEKNRSEFYKDSATNDGLNYKCKSCAKKLKIKSKDRIAEWSKKYVQQKHVKAKSRKNALAYYYKTKDDPIHKTKRSLRRLINQALKAKFWIKDGPSEELLGCSYEHAIQHFEDQFTEGMNWSNHGEWHIDHITPLDSANTIEELNKLCHYTNLQPLWAVDNLRKNKY